MSELNDKTIESIERLVKEATHATRFRLAHDPEGIERVHYAGLDRIDTIESPRPPYDIDLADPASMKEFIKHPPAFIETDINATLFVSEDFLSLRLTDHFEETLRHRADRVTVRLGKSPQYVALAEKCRQPMTQRDFVRLLRIDLRGALPADTDLLAIARNLRWSSASSAQATITNTRESLGRSITQEVLGESAIPDEIKLTIPIWDRWSFRASIVCAIEADAATQTFRLTPYPQEMQNAIDAAIASLVEFLGDAGVNTYYGQP